MNTAATIGLLSLPQFYSTKQVINSSTTSSNTLVSGSSITTQISDPSIADTNYKHTITQASTIASLPTSSNNSQFIHQQNSQFQTTSSTPNQLLLQNHYNNFQALQNQQATSQQQKDIITQNTTRSSNNNNSNLMQSSLVNVNNSVTITNQHHIQQSQQQPALIESLVQSVPNATSTPNPIQQQQQHDIFANLLLKFDPTSFFQKKHTVSEQIFNVSNLNGLSLNQMNSNQANSNSGKMNINTPDSKKVIFST